jgi:hypothetical protein
MRMRMRMQYVLAYIYIRNYNINYIYYICAHICMYMHMYTYTTTCAINITQLDACGGDGIRSNLIYHIARLMGDRPEHVYNDPFFIILFFIFGSAEPSASSSRSQPISPQTP